MITNVVPSLNQFASKAVYRHFKHAFRFLCVWPGDLSTHHTWRAIVAPDLYTRNRFSESMGSRTTGTANNERVHSFCKFLPNPFIQDLFL